MRTTRSITAALAVALLALTLVMSFSGCSPHPLATAPNATTVNPPCDTCPPDTTDRDTTCTSCGDTIYIPIGTPCGEVRLEDFYVTRSQPEKYLGSYYFSAPAEVVIFVREDNLRDGGGHDGQDAQFRFLGDAGGIREFDPTPGDGCAILADTSGVHEVTRFAGRVTIPPGTWKLVALHGSRVSCDADAASAPVSIKDGQMEWCYLK